MKQSQFNASILFFPTAVQRRSRAGVPVKHFCPLANYLQTCFSLQQLKQKAFVKLTVWLRGNPLIVSVCSSSSSATQIPKTEGKSINQSIHNDNCFLCSSLWFSHFFLCSASSNCIESSGYTGKRGGRHRSQASENTPWPFLSWLIYLCQLDDQETDSVSMSLLLNSVKSP